jgi:hypothetical protein
MSSYIVETIRGYFLVVAGATDSQQAMKLASAYAPQFGIPMKARPTSTDIFEDEPPIALYLTAPR